MADNPDDQANVCYGITLLLKHPALEPGRISEALEMDAFVSHQVGAPRRTPTGTPLTGVYRETAWSHKFELDLRQNFFRRVEQIVSALLKYEDFFTGFSESGGNSELYVQLPGSINQGANLEFDVLLSMARLKLTLSVEVFPHMRTHRAAAE